jgi:hypothetical protein
MENREKPSVINETKERFEATERYNEAGRCDKA